VPEWFYLAIASINRGCMHLQLFEMKYLMVFSGFHFLVVGSRKATPARYFCQPKSLVSLSVNSVFRRCGWERGPSENDLKYHNGARVGE